MSTAAQHLQGCPTCARDAMVSLFDVAVRTDDGDERHFFGLPAALCRCCGLQLAGDASRLFGIDDADVVSAIQSDRCLDPALGFDAA